MMESFSCFELVAYHVTALPHEEREAMSDAESIKEQEYRADVQTA
jgi:hypothetical protein